MSLFNTYDRIFSIYSKLESPTREVVEAKNSIDDLEIYKAIEYMLDSIERKKDMDIENYYICVGPKKDSMFDKYNIKEIMVYSCDMSYNYNNGPGCTEICLRGYVKDSSTKC